MDVTCSRQCNLARAMRTALHLKHVTSRLACVVSSAREKARAKEREKAKAKARVRVRVKERARARVKERAKETPAISCFTCSRLWQTSSTDRSLRAHASRCP